MHILKPLLGAALLALSAAGAQAANLQLLSASTSGSNQTVVSTQAGESIVFTGNADDLSGLTEVLAFGAGNFAGSPAPVNGAGISNEWFRMATLDASGAVTRFQATGSSALNVYGPLDLGGLTESADIGLSADLLVASDGEAVGTAVTVRLQLSAESLFSATVAGSTDTPTFNLLVLDAANTPLASYNGLTLNGRDTLDLSFSSAVGQTLSFSLSYANVLDVAPGVLGLPNSAESSALLQGSLTVTAVPEPHSLALLLAGLGVVGAVARRRR
ncbi:PEP-CTERM sorting domain-containing protein [Pelomonas sp. UHG3]|uniref:PEP-CTERM sorting domain-containing protein n=1 Tax=Roseateles hydrophilus TaxID=2975054 RepID=A0ACC6C5H7_9BURK|nr:PEP-CTERM sorting domain-containing protein [Pelomonas sp. UHG3]MCY4743678.1 PEP-CTERM sorting domain-containing protein [Pelomonas sp. UHG3]